MNPEVEAMSDKESAEAEQVITPDLIEDYTHGYCDRTRAAAKDSDGDDRVRWFTASTAIRDRYGDEIPVSAWDTKWYAKNPVMLWAHHYDKLPIARGVGIELTDKALRIGFRFTLPEENIEGDQVMRLYDGGYLNAVSVGFRSKASEWINPEDEDEIKRSKKEPDVKPGKRFTKVELLEVSAVPVPANPEALMCARRKGLVVPEARNFFIVYPQQAAASQPAAFVAAVTQEIATSDNRAEIVTAAVTNEQPETTPAHAEGQVETDNGPLAASPQPPASGQPDECVRMSAELLESLLKAIRLEHERF